MKTLLVPTDFSVAASNATIYAAKLAQFFNAKLVLVNAFPVAVSNSIDPQFPIDIIDSAQKTALKNVELAKVELLAIAKTQLNIVCEAEMGGVDDVVDNMCKKHNPDYIIMGIINKPGVVKEYFLGSSSVNVARHASVPTFIIPEGVKYKPIKHITFACDLDKTEESPALMYVKRFSKLFGAELEIVNVEKPEEDVSYNKARTSVYIEKRLETIKHKLTYVTENKVAEGIENYVDEHPTDLLVVCPKKHNVFHTLFKESVTKHLAFHVHHLPILAMH